MCNDVDVIYIKMKNDVAFILDSYLTLWEQQSSYNPNMPVRGLMYYGKMYDKYIKSNSLNIYGSTLVKIPTPRYIVFYNGTKDVAKAVDDAVVSCINDGILKEFLLAHRAEVIEMCLTEYDEKTFVNGIKEEGRKEGQKEGRDSERRELIAKLFKRGKTPEEISDFCGYPMELIDEVQKNLFTTK